MMKPRLAISVFALLLLPRVSLAAVKVWDGGGTDSNWTTPANWVGDVAPVPGADSLEFPENAARKLNVNDFPSSSHFLGINFSGATGGYVLSGQLVFLEGPVTSANTSGTNTINFPITTSTNGLAGLTAVNPGGTLATTGSINLNFGQGGDALSLSGAGTVHVAGSLVSTGNVIKSGAGVAILTYANTYTGTTVVQQGTLIVNGVQSGSPVTMTGGIVGGTGTLGALATYSGTVSPGASAGVLRAGNAFMTGGATFRVELNGSFAGDYDQLNVTGSVDLGGATLNATLGYVPANNAQFTIINNDGSDAVVGTLAGLPQGASLMIGGRSFTISYVGGSGNDVVLTADAISFISGTVTNAMTAAPVANTTVTIYSSTGSALTSASTNAQGVYMSTALPTGSYFVRARPSSTSGLLGQLYNNVPCPESNCTVTNGTPVAVTAPGVTPNINFALPVAGTITGTVTSAATSAPLASALVRVYSNTGSFLTNVFTNAQGTYSIIVADPTGSYFVTVRPPSSSGLLGQLYNNLPCPDGDCQTGGGTPVSVIAPNATTVNFALAAGGTIAGTVTSATNGAPVANTTVYVYSQTDFVASASTNAQGDYAMNVGLETGSYFVFARPPSQSGLLGQLYNNVPCPDGNCIPTSGTPVPVMAGNTSVINFSLPAGGTITGMVTDATTEAPVPNTSVTIYSSTGSSVAFASTNAQGIYTISTGLPSGSYYVKAQPPSSSGLLGQVYENLLCHNGNCSVTSGTPVIVTQQNATTVNFALPTGATITGTVTNATTAAPVANLFVEFYTSTGQYIAVAATNAQGFYTSPALIPGTYLVRAEPSSNSGLVVQLYSNIQCPELECSLLSGTPVVATGPTPNIDFPLLQPPVAPNDSFATAIVIGSVPYRSFVNTSTATTGAEDPVVSCGNGSTQRSVWYRYTPAVDGPVVVNTFGSGYNTILAIYTGSPGSFASVGCNDNTSGSQSALTVQGIAGQSLTILVTSSSGSGGILVLNVAGIPGSFGKVSPGLGKTTRLSVVTLSWGTSAGAQSYEYCIDTSNNTSCSTAWVPVGDVTSVKLTDLLPNTQYSWQVRAVNIGTTTYAEGSTSAFWIFTTGRSLLVHLNGDANGDVFAHNMATGAWQRGLAQADGGFATVSGGWNAGWTVVPATFDGDALTDLFLFNTSSGQWQKLLSSVTGFTVQASGSWWPGWERHVIDLDGNGLSDFFLYDSASGTWFKALSTPTGFVYVQGGWNPTWEIHPMRFNDDAFGDIFLINRTTGRWFWVLGAAGGAFTYPASEAWYPGWQLYPGDFNGDGLSDFLLHDPPTGTYFVAFTGASGFTYQQGGWSLGWTPYVLDLDADGKDDLFLHDSATGVWFQMIGDGAGNFINAGGQTWSLGWTLHPTDFNGDGRADLLLYDPGTGAYYQARNLANGSFTYSNGMWAPGLTVITRSPVR